MRSWDLPTEALILGCGFTGLRVAQGLLAKGWRVTATTRHPKLLAGLAMAGARVLRVDTQEAVEAAGVLAEVGEGIAALHSIPPGAAPDEGMLRVLDALKGRAARMVHLSTTGVYGGIRDVDERTAPAPRTDREKRRLRWEEAAAAGPWSTMILRPAAIYGPGRGVHEAMRRGKFRLRGTGENWVSRIHVEDLAALTEAALGSDVAGAWPVADDEPCESREIAAYCAQLFGIPMAGSAAEEELSETRQADRRVDGRAIRRVLGVELRYPSFRVGIPAALRPDGILLGSPRRDEAAG